MTPFTTLGDALAFIEQDPLASDHLEIPMADGFTVDGKPDQQIGALTMGEVGLIMALVKRDFKRVGCDRHEGFRIYRFSRIKMSSAEDEPFPADFKPQRVRLPNAVTLASLPPSELAKYFDEHPDTATDLISESEDKRYSPSTFITRKHNGFRVGWFSTARGQQCVTTFEKRSDAAADYLLFSLGKGRWNGRILRPTV